MLDVTGITVSTPDPDRCAAAFVPLLLTITAGRRGEISSTKATAKWCSAAAGRVLEHLAG